MWTGDLLRHVIAYLRGIRVQDGTRLRARVDIEARGVIYYRAPVTTGFRCRIPRGAILVVYSEPGFMFFSCTVRDAALEAQIVPPEDRLNEKYAGCAFIFGLGEIGRRFEILPGEPSGDLVA